MKRLILFIHGLGGSVAGTWGDFDRFVREDSELSSEFDTAHFEYLTGLISSAVPSTTQVAKCLAAYLLREHANRDRITMIAHSLGGLVARRYICDALQRTPSIPLRVTGLLTFGTPHLGTSTAYAGQRAGSAQVRDLAVDSDFLMRLGEDWHTLAAHERVRVKYVVAANDAIVSQTSARGAEWSDGHEVIPGIGHVPMVKPDTKAALSFRIAKQFLLTKDELFLRFAKPDYRQPLLLRRTVANKERNRFFFGAEVIEFMGRDTELGILAEMLDAASAVFRWTVMHGSGGVGKSRLAHELCKRLEREWYAGFLSQRDMSRDWRVWQPMLPTLMVVDYAAQSFYERDDNPVSQMIGDLADRAAGQGMPLARPVRVLLLERENTGEWLQSIFDKSRNAQDMKFPLATTIDLKLTTVSDPWALIAFVLLGAGRLLPPREETLAKLKEIDAESRPLFAHLMADAILREPDNWRALDADRLIADVINRDRNNYWRPAGATAREERALAVATMVGGLSVSDLSACAEPLLPSWDLDVHPAIFRAMAATSSGERVAPLEPDIVGEHFVLQLLEADNLTQADRLRLCDLAWSIGPAAMIQFILRAHNDASRKQMLAVLREPPADARTARYWFAGAVMLLGMPSINAAVAQKVIDSAVDRIYDARLPFFARLQGRSPRTEFQQIMLDRLWIAAAAAPERVAEISFEPELEAVGFFLRSAAARGEYNLLMIVCNALEGDPQRLVELALARPLTAIGALVSAAHDIGLESLVTAVYNVLAKHMERLRTQAFATSLDSVASFLETAGQHGQETLTVALCKALEANPEGLFDQASSIPLEKISVFLRWAHQHNHHGTVSTFYKELEKWPIELTENALAFQLDSVGHFLVTAHEHGRKELVTDMYSRLIDDSQRLAERAFATPLHKVSFFIKTASKHNQSGLVSVLWKAFAVKPTQLTASIREASPSFVASFLVTVPPDLPSVGEAVIKPLDVKSWEFGQYRSERFSTGAPGLALLFGKYGRQDLKQALITNTLRRKNPSDFYQAEHRLLEISRLLCNASQANQEYVTPFIDAVCTRSALDASFDKASTLGVAGALTNLATYLNPEIVARFWCPGLDRRLRMVAARLPTATLSDLSGSVQLLGGCSLAGWMIHRNLLDAAPLDSIGRLPIDVLPHAAGADEVQAWQRQLWLGLRVIASLCSGTVSVGKPVIGQTLTLWRRNLSETNQMPDSPPHRINVSMIRWLTRCMDSEDGTLLPDGEPLWVLAGFPENPRKAF